MRSSLKSLPAFVADEGRLSTQAVVATYVASLCIFAIAVGLRFWFDPYLPQGFPFLTFFPAVLLSGFVFGVRQGIMVAALSGIASWYFFIPPGGFDTSVGTLFAMGLYLFVVASELTLIWLMMRAYRAETVALMQARRLAEQQETMAQELDHRLKNIFATTNAIISLSLKGVTSAEELASRLRERLSALGRSNLLLRGLRDGEEASLGTVIEQALEPFSIVGTGRFSSSGPHVPVSGQTVVLLSLVLHELGTNAAKYGALSVPGGHVSLTWEFEPGAASGGKALGLTWRETSGPAPDLTSRRDGGFGSTLIRRVMAGMRGETTIDFPPEGAIVHLTLPEASLHPVQPSA